MTIIPAKLLTVATVNDAPVSFFSPPHDGPDFPWVDVKELVSAFMPDIKSADRFVQHVWNFHPGARVCTTATNGAKIVTIIPHNMAQGLCDAFDEIGGFDTDEDDHGPRFREYCLCAGIAAADHWPLSFKDMAIAFRECGGPFMASMRVGAEA